MSDDGWGDEDAGWTDGDAAAAPAAGDEEVEEEEKPRGGGGDGKCRNCRQVTREFRFLDLVMSSRIGVSFYVSLRSLDDKIILRRTD